MYFGVKGSSIIAVSSTDIIGAVDREEDLELALIDKSMDDCQGAEVESMDKDTESSEGESVTKRGIGLGNMLSNSD